MRIRIAFLLELILALAVGMGLARADPKYAELLAGFPLGLRNWITQVIGNVSAGFALVVGLATFIERARGRSPLTWGPGRSATSILCIYVIYLNLAKAALVFRISLLFVRVHAFWLRGTGLDKLLQGNGLMFQMSVPWFVLGLGITYLVVRPARDPSPDAREWAGRVFSALVVVVPIAGIVCEVIGLGF